MRLWILGLLFILTSCQTDVSLALEPKNTYYGNAYKSIDESEVQDKVFQDSYYELFWRDGFPIRFFDYSHRNTVLLLKQYGKISENTEIVSVEIIIVELNVSQIFEVNENMKVSKNNYIYLITLNDCLSDILNNQDDLLKFESVKEVSVKISLREEQKDKSLMFNFVPVLKKSVHALNGIMSV